MHKLLDKVFNFLYPVFRDWGMSRNFASYISLIFNIIILIALAYVIYYAAKFVLVTLTAVFAQRTKTKFDDYLIQNKTTRYTAYLIPFFFIYKAVPIILDKYDYWELLFGKIVGIYIVLLGLWIVRTVFNSLRDYLKQKPEYSDKPIDSFVQVIMIVLWIFGVALIISTLFGIKKGELLTILGTLSAIIILIFRDTILGFVSSVQVAINDMVRIGDWITMDKFGADGDVIEINLTTVKVRNFDNTITTIPTYALSSDSFQNWRGMQKSEGRRIKRHVLIKSSTIRFLNTEDLAQMRKIQLITAYIDSRQAEIEKYNDLRGVDKTLSLNGRNMTNLGLFRKYIMQYLMDHPGLNKNMHIMCRQLQSTAHGVPLEIYVFSSDKRWANYEYIMADIFDHVMASVGYFDLEIFELPSQIGKLE
ncbi:MULTISPECIES: mechanosensitive ion channel domain-containing protein [unclassified Flavobacterium]|jgi:miniconductance mechanosensitive channel|uniref:mechanosensitive ion channel family protein n=1 Tax=unclassified Flavobacterium TaxID=196869 RepID=UPI00070F9467|nr:MULTISPECIES: mechanosensitive ion channel domain-containing protein [unclassified Flavobacterium]KRD57686.1 mechanosensitive ion channel protein MscS [Flavobacterium sp. Root935]MDQ1165823.1 miniconductance mechanosensitive channel [Flavobacterium sp. SORGH_AS_0622]TDX10325.1 miniconductance mechanosensitive channel [Flavobacterium sp. S87F.05.LMB.W.Kidney.N]BDU26435.1 mechanosensitive ion channel protein MscS [Flavobacterium sp. GSB-24]